MPAIDLSILNQRQTPAFYADTLANRPAAGFVGRIFVSTNTFAFFRDNGTGWDLIGGPGTGTITGSGTSGQIALWDGASTITGDTGLTYNGTANSLTASQFIVTGGTLSQFLKADGSLDNNTYNTGSGLAGQVAFFSGTNAITGNNDLFWDNVNGHLGIGTNVPGTALQIDHDQSQLIRLNQTTATNDTKIAFQNSGTALWRIGNSYNAGANDFGIFDVIGTFQPITVKKTTGQVLIGTSTVGSGKLVVASSISDNGVQIVGAAAPSLRIDNAESGPTKRAGFGISTATNNFIQGSADRDFCMFNGSTTASPILFGIYDTTNVQEAARISAARNFLIGTTTDSGERLIVNGTCRITTTSTNPAILMPLPTNANATILQTYSSNIGFGWKLQQDEVSTGNFKIFRREGNIDYEVLNLTRSNGAATFAGDVYLGGATSASGLLSASKLIVNNEIGIQRTDTTGPYIRQVVGNVNQNVTFVTGAFSGANPNLDFNVTGSGINLRLASSTGNLLIGTTTDIGARLHASGNIIASGTGSANGLLSRDNNNSTTYGFVNDGAGSLTLTNSGVGNVGNFNMATGIYTPTSDKNKKKNFEQSNIGLEAVLNLKPTLYNMISQSDHEAKELGFIAQEVKEVIEQAYVQNGDFIGLNYQPIIATLVKAIQELNTKIENIK